MRSSSKPGKWVDVAFVLLFSTWPEVGVLVDEVALLAIRVGNEASIGTQIGAAWDSWRQQQILEST